MLSLQLPSRLVSVPNSYHRNEKPFSVPRSTAGKRTNLESWTTRRPRLAVTAVDGKTMAGELRPEAMPKHVAFIIDGHERWARSRGLTVHDGHKAGAMNFKHLASNCCQLGIQILTPFAFGTQNWNRPKVEVDFLLNACEDFIGSVI